MNDLVKPNRIFSARPILGTLGFYALVAGLIFWADRVTPSGPCVPGLGILFLLILPFVSLILLLVTALLAIKGRKSQIVPAIFHGLVVLTVICLWYYSRR